MGAANELTPQNSYTRVDQETVYYVQNLRGDVVSLASEEFVGEGENRQRVEGRILETVRYTAFGVPQVFRRLAADIADDQGTPLDHGQRTLANVGNSNGKKVPITTLPVRAANHTTMAQDPDKAEHLVRVGWIKTVPLKNAVKEKGFFGNQNSAAKPRAKNWPFTVKRLRQRFGISDGGV